MQERKKIGQYITFFIFLCLQVNNLFVIAQDTGSTATLYDTEVGEEIVVDEETDSDEYLSENDMSEKDDNSEATLYDTEMGEEIIFDIPTTEENIEKIGDTEEERVEELTLGNDSGFSGVNIILSGSSLSGSTLGSGKNSNSQTIIEVEPSNKTETEDNKIKEEKEKEEKLEDVEKEETKKTNNDEKEIELQDQENQEALEDNIEIEAEVFVLNADLTIEEYQQSAQQQNKEKEKKEKKKYAKGYLKKNTRIRSIIKGSIDKDDLIIYELQNTPQAFTSPFLGGVSFGPEDDHLTFSQPIQLDIPIDATLNNQKVAIYVAHAGKDKDKYATAGLSTNPDVRCAEDGSIVDKTDIGNITQVVDGQVTIYTCGASTFVVTYVGGKTTNNFVDNSSTGKVITITTGDVSAGSTITDINVIVDFWSIDGEDFTSPGVGQAYADEISFTLESPTGTTIDLLVIDTYTDTSNAPRVTVTFDDAAGTTPSGLPTTGTFLPTDNLSDFNTEDPLGDWIFTFSDDTNQDGLILFEVQLQITDDATCGDSTLGGSEGCDDGGTSDGDGCNASCLIETTYACNTSSSGATLGASCTSGICDETEVTPTCEAVNTCGNNIVEAGEQCDDGNTTNGDNCDSGCQFEFCGNGVIDLAPIVGGTIFLEDFETIGNGSSTTDGVIYSSGSYTLSFENSTANGRIRYGTNRVQDNGGAGAGTLDVNTNNSLNTNYLIFEFDLSDAVDATDLELAFDRADHGDEAQVNDKVWVRGSNSDSRIEIYDWKANDIGNGNYQSVTALDIDATLASNSQSPSSTFAIRIGQEDNFPANNTNSYDGLSIDNVEVTGTLSGPVVDETCDDSNTTNGDGCDNLCQIENGRECSGEPSVCSSCIEDIIKVYLVENITNTTQSISYNSFTTHTYGSTPIVLATPQTANSTNNYPIPVISNVTTAGFDISICLDNGNSTCAATPNAEDIAIFVIDTDKTACADHIEAGTTTITTAGSDTAFSFANTFTNTPYVFTTPQTSNQGGNIAAHAWVDDGSLSVNGGDFVGCVHQGTDNTCTAGQPNETLGWIAIDPTLFTLSNYQDGEVVVNGSTWTNITFGPSYSSPPAVMVTQNSDNGGQDPQYARAKDVTPTGGDVRYCEMDGNNDCDTHTNEDVMRFSLPFPVCGNARVDEVEECDDGNTTNGDGCSDICELESPLDCGNSKIDAGEQCDDGNTIDGDGCSSTCQLEDPLMCGDGNIDAGETCDDNNTTPGDGCDEFCQTEVIGTGDMCIFGPTSFTFSGMIYNDNISHQIEQQFDEYFSVEDGIGSDLGYYTTLQITNFSGMTHGDTLSHDILERYSTGINLLSGDVNTGVVLATGRSSYRPANMIYTFIERNTGINSGKTGTYGTLPWLRLTIPAYTKPDIYQAEICYTLYEN